MLTFLIVVLGVMLLVALGFFLYGCVKDPEAFGVTVLLLVLSGFLYFGFIQETIDKNRTEKDLEKIYKVDFKGFDRATEDNPDDPGDEVTWTIQSSSSILKKCTGYAKNFKGIGWRLVDGPTKCTIIKIVDPDDGVFKKEPA